MVLGGKFAEIRTAIARSGQEHTRLYAWLDQVHVTSGLVLGSVRRAPSNMPTVCPPIECPTAAILLRSSRLAIAATIALISSSRSRISFISVTRARQNSGALGALAANPVTLELAWVGWITTKPCCA